MSMNSLIQRLTSKAPTQSSLSIVVLSDGVYLSKVESESGIQATTYHELKESSWDFVLDTALEAESCTNLNATVTFGSHFYQSYQIDKPAIPEDEWSVALPFLLKDLITDRVTEIVADGIAVPHSSKIQAYVLTKRLIEQLKEVLERHQIQLLQILPEDEVWSQTRTDTSAFMLLHRSASSEFKIGAFVEESSVFQRTVRGIHSPITGEYSNTIQLDGLALELQRSMDYLSSQLKQVQINKLFLCCDGEQEHELQAALQERLNVSVEPLLLGVLPQKSGNILALEAYRRQLQGVNLYPAHLKPKKEAFNLGLVAISWLVIAVFMLGIYGFYNYKNYTLDKQVAEQKKQAQQLSVQVKSLQTKLSAHQPSPAKVASVERLKADVKTKQDSLKVINSFDAKQQVGYSGIMHGLSTIGRNDISLTSIQIDNDRMNVQGLAKSPAVVPKWVQHFKTEMNLVGRTFESLSIGRNEDDVVIFSLRSHSGDK
ncbi:hypothetical protein [Vibrio rumoiensis]|uniref:MSHA biogenesis protein MshI n=1 Tax=Vibrio rumoiensis 1S-45 TaxID=1188252 RepID=A0A1E5E5S9_9VIBR|nr:hypothetical protein [Vibrio rumoiensis]OEF28478.1 MSHA biogenesis protein MshI [Vibrio rumoiensis 1S-45]